MRASPWIAVAFSSWAIASCAHAHRASERARADLASGAMVSVPGGRFRLAHGSGPFEQIPTFVSVGAFLLDVTEVTVGAYHDCVRAGRCEPALATVKWGFVLGGGDRASWSRFCNQDRPDRADHPVNCVDWGQAAAYCAWAGKRLPSEEEWEWAARNGRAATPTPWGDAPPAGQPCWDGPGNDAGAGKRPGTCVAGSHPADASTLGVRDLGGGVSEWTTSETLVGQDSRGRGGSWAMVFRGGSWWDEDPEKVTSFARSSDLPSRRDPRLGFRCASDP